MEYNTHGRMEHTVSGRDTHDENRTYSRHKGGRIMTTVAICDKCGKQIDQLISNAQIITYCPHKETLHLCRLCLEDFERWLTKAQ